MRISVGDKTAIVFTEKSLVSEKLIALLLENTAYKKVKLFSPTKPNIKSSKLEYYSWSLSLNALSKDSLVGDDLFCFLDIKRPKSSTPSDIKIRHTYSYAIAQLAAKNGVNQLFFLSSINANKDALNQNSRIRAYLEESLFQLPFWGVHIFRPSLIVDTEGQPQWGVQIADKIRAGLDKITNGAVTKYQPTEAKYVASVMIEVAQNLKGGAFLYRSEYFSDWEEKANLLE